MENNKETEDKEQEKSDKIKGTKIIELNSKEFKINLENLQGDIKKAYDSMRKLVPDSITEREIKPFGNASHIILPKEYAYRKAKVIIKK
jgi:putative transposon-encoded protein